MKRLAWAMMVVVTSIPGWKALMAQSTPPKVIAEFRGSSLKWIHAAEPEFKRKELDLDKYIVVIAEQGASIVVGLKSSDSVEGARGSTGKYPGYEVEISKQDLKIIRSNYIR